MATTTKDKTPEKQEQVAQEAPAANLPTVLKQRLPYSKSLEAAAGIDQRGWGVLIDAVFPNAKTIEAVMMAIFYCKNRNLDIFKRPIHIVPIYSTALGREVESIWPGIAELRITAHRTGVYAGKDASEFGEEITETLCNIDSRNGAVKGEKEVTYPEWCQVTVYRIVQGVSAKFVGPKVWWKEAYATENRYSDIPNEMWGNRTNGQLEKCAEAAALRVAFPEELGNEYAAEEMANRKVSGLPPNMVHEGTFSEVMTPPRPQQSEFEQKPAAKQEEKKPEPVKPEPKKEEPKPTKAADTGGDPRGDIPPVGEAVDDRSEPGQGVRRDAPLSGQGDDAEPDEEEEYRHTEAWPDAQNTLAALEEGLRDIQAVPDLKTYRSDIRKVIDEIEDISSDERHELHMRFTTATTAREKEIAARRPPAKAR